MCNTNNEVYMMVISDLDFDLPLNGYEVPADSQISTIFVTNRSSVYNAGRSLTKTLKFIFFSNKF